MTERHLQEIDIEALAHGRADLVDDALRLHAHKCATCREALAEARGVSRIVESSWSASSLPGVDLDALVESAVANATLVPSGWPPRRGRILAAGTIASIAAAVLGAVAIDRLPSPAEVGRLLGEAASLVAASLHVVEQIVPGGWPTVTIVAGFVLLLLSLPMRWLLSSGRVLGAGGPFSLVLSVLLLVMAPAASSYAIDFEGEWSQEERFSLELTNRLPAEIVRHAASVLGLEFVHTALPSTPCSIHRSDISLRELLEELFRDEPLVAVRHDNVLSIRAARGSEVIRGAPGNPPIEPMERTPPSEGDRISAGGNIHIRRGERVGDVFSAGGNVVIEGVVTGDVTTWGGNVDIRSGAEVHGELMVAGGNISIAEDAVVYDRAARAFGGNVSRGGETESARDDDAEEERGEESWLRRTAGAVSGYLVLFVLGLILMGAVPQRFDAVRRAIVQRPARSLLTGILGYPMAALLTVVLVLTIIGLPVAVAVVLVAFLASYIGLVATASVIGASLPLQSLKDRPVLQLASGVLVLFVLSRLPGLGGLFVFVAACIGFGATLLTRFRAT